MIMEAKLQKLNEASVTREDLALSITEVANEVQDVSDDVHLLRTSNRR